jgi:Flp pilus assembly protein TadB
MASTKEQQLQAFARRAARVSKALWPTNVRRSIATGRAAQTRRRLIVKSKNGRWSSLFPIRSGEQGDSSFPVQLEEPGRPQGTSSFPILLGEPGRPQGAPPLVHSTPAPTMTVVVATMSVLAGASILILVVARLWLILTLLIAALVAIFLLLAIISARVSSMKRPQQGAERRSFPGVLSRAHSPNTPMPLEPPLVRVLETFDLSQTNVEHFLDLPEGGNTGGYSLENWKEAQTSLPSEKYGRL